MPYLVEESSPGCYMIVREGQVPLAYFPSRDEAQRIADKMCVLARGRDSQGDAAAPAVALSVAA